MIEAKKRNVIVTCDCPGCPTKHVEPIGYQPTAADVARVRADREANGGWFIELIPGKGPREFCPGKHADAYRTMLAALLDTIPRTGRAGAGDRRRAS